MTVLELRRRLGGATCGEVLMLLGEADLPLPRAPVEGREEQISACAMFLRSFSPRSTNGCFSFSRTCR